MIFLDILWLNEGRNLVVMLMINVIGVFIGFVYIVKWERFLGIILLLEFKRFKLLSCYKFYDFMFKFLKWKIWN